LRDTKTMQRAAWPAVERKVQRTHRAANSAV